MITIFSNLAATSKLERVLTPQEWAQALRENTASHKEGLPLISGAQFGEQFDPETGCLRTNENIIAITHVVADYDAEEHEVSWAIEIIQRAEIRAFIHTTPSNMVNGHGPRWRVICPLSQPRSAEQHYKLVSRLNGLLSGVLARESWNPSQSFYFGTVTGNPLPTGVYLGGRHLDLCEELDAGAIGKPNGGAGTAGHDGDGDAADGFDIAAALAEIRQGRNLHENIVSITGKLAAHGVSVEDALAIVRNAFGLIDLSQHTPQRRKEIADRIADLERSGGFAFKQEWERRERGKAFADALKRQSAAQATTSAALWADDLADLDGPIPRREWIVKHYLLRGHVTALFGLTSEGKSTLAIFWAVAMALAPGDLPRIVNQFVTHGGLRVLIYSLEEDQVEQRRRIRATLQVFGQPGTALGGRLMSTGCDSVGTLFQHDPKTGVIIRTELFRQLRAQVEQHRADVVIFDPMVELHTAPENDNALMRIVTAELRTLARELRIAVLLLHHAPKGTITPGDISALRGAGAIGGAVRFGYTVVRMTEEEAKECRIPDRLRGFYFRADKAKGSYSPPISEAEWFLKVGYDIDGEEVGTVRPWRPQEAKEATDVDIEGILSEIAKGCPTGKPWSPQRRDSPRSIRILLQRFGFMGNEAESGVMDTLKTRGVEIVCYRDEHRNTPQGLRFEGKPSASWCDEHDAE